VSFPRPQTLRHLPADLLDLLRFMTLCILLAASPLAVGHFFADSRTTTVTVLDLTGPVDPAVLLDELTAAGQDVPGCLAAPATGVPASSEPVYCATIRQYRQRTTIVADGPGGAVDEVFGPGPEPVPVADGRYVSRAERTLGTSFGLLPALVAALLMVILGVLGLWVMLRLAGSAGSAGSGGSGGSGGTAGPRPGGSGTHPTRGHPDGGGKHADRPSASRAQLTGPQHAVPQARGSADRSRSFRPYADQPPVRDLPVPTPGKLGAEPSMPSMAPPRAVPDQAPVALQTGDQVIACTPFGAAGGYVESRNLILWAVAQHSDERIGPGDPVVVAGTSPVPVVRLHRSSISVAPEGS
jgi:hypothetical protein